MSFSYSTIPNYYVQNNSNITQYSYDNFINDYASYVSTIVNVPKLYSTIIQKTEQIALNTVFLPLANIIIKNTKSNDFILTDEKLLYVLIQKFTITEIKGVQSAIKYSFYIQNNVIILQNSDNVQENIEIILTLN